MVPSSGGPLAYQAFRLALALSLPQQYQSDDKHQYAPQDEAGIKVKPVGRIDNFVYVVNAKQVVIDEALDNVEAASSLLDQYR